jgi:hypothetical protein
MAARRHVGAGLLLAALLIGPSRLPAAGLLPLEIKDGRAEYVLPTPDPQDSYFLIVSALACDAGPYTVRVATEASAAPPSLPRARPVDDPAWKQRVAQRAARLERARLAHRPAAPYPPLAAPPAQKVFHLFVEDRDFLNPRAYAAVTAELRRVGRHCQVYVDRAVTEDDGLRAAEAEAARVFDDEVYPRSRALLGEALDVDRDGRFTLLFTGWLAKMQAGKVSLGGFVRGSDFYRDLDAPFGNRCDMMYLNGGLRAGPFLRTLLAHEYTHAVVFSEHVFGGYTGLGPAEDDESWLNEGLAHVVEDLHGYGWDNLDYRVSAFLNAPERYRLVVPDYYGTGLWRSPGTRGATYLFLRSCMDRQRTGLVRRLAQSGLKGVDNLETATQEPFDDLFRRWSAALVLAGTGLEGDGGTTPVRPNLRRPLGRRLLCGPRFREMPLAAGRQAVALTGTSTAFFLLHSPAGRRSRVTITADPAARLQVTLVPLPRDYPRLGVAVEELPDRAGVRLRLTAHGGEVVVTQVAWERLLPDGSPEDTSYRPATNLSEAVKAWLPGPRLPAGQQRTSHVIALPAGGRHVIKVAGTDRRGRQVAGWAVVSR